MRNGAAGREGCRHEACVEGRIGARDEGTEIGGRFAAEFFIAFDVIFENRARFIETCRDTLRDDRGLAIPLDDNTVIRLLTSIRNSRRDQVDDILSELVTEVWAA